MPPKLSQEVVAKTFEDRGYILLEEYKNALTKVRYQCPKHPNSEISIRFRDFKKGQGCPHCAREARSLKYEDVKAEFRRRGYILLESSYINNFIKMRYRCPEHPDKELSISYHNLKDKGAGCPYCAGQGRPSFNDVQALFADKGFELIDTKYENNKSKLRYRCLNHPEKIRTARLDSVQRVRGCRQCFLDRNRGENHPHWNGGSTELTVYLRKMIDEWKWEAFNSFDGKCAITGESSRCLQVHHTKQFSVIRDEVLKVLNLPHHTLIGDYTSNELEAIVNLFRQRHEEVVGVPLKKEVHKLFHMIYGKKNTTMEDLIEFKARFLSGEFNGSEIEKPIQLSLVI